MDSTGAPLHYYAQIHSTIVCLASVQSLLLVIKKILCSNTQRVPRVLKGHSLFKIENADSGTLSVIRNAPTEI
ncbi:hypothetical protein RchiOBHm_Chr5g0028251 [Rosa chinensis]|uniref:Uncharacterized protein n=1 Tax=Rosa chinensis TaxID=74649 RepID=A0A2P6Q9B2_ROSCH|nr:hypothetical protein RchiOBHm_Chr5g0028251 [Rosa chinensis]